MVCRKVGYTTFYPGDGAAVHFYCQKGMQSRLIGSAKLSVDGNVSLNGCLQVSAL